MIDKIVRAIENPLFVRRKVRQYLDLFTHKRTIKKAVRYSQEHELEKIMQAGASDEMRPITHDLVNVHREIRRRMPEIVLEIGVGFSTIVMCAAGQAFEIGMANYVTRSKNCQISYPT